MSRCYIGICSVIQSCLKHLKTRATMDKLLPFRGRHANQTPLSGTIVIDQAPDSHSHGIPDRFVVHTHVESSLFVSCLALSCVRCTLLSLPSFATTYR